MKQNILQVNSLKETDFKSASNYCGDEIFVSRFIEEIVEDMWHQTAYILEKLLGNKCSN
jgi:hypothetical protein